MPRPRDLGRDIRSLLGPPRHGPAGPLAILPPIGVREGVADWSPTTYSPWLGAALLAPEMHIEPGLLTWSQDPATLDYPYVLATPAWLDTWVAGAGATVPGSDPSRAAWSLGLLAADEALTPPWTWPDGLDYEGQVYPSYVRLGGVLGIGAQLAYPATPYRGGARLWAEACLSHGLLLSARMPAGCSPSAESLGLIWSPQGDLWAMDASADGLLAWRMEPPGLTAPLWGLLVAGTVAWDSTTAHLWRLYVCASMVPADTDQAIELLSADDMAPLYADGAAALAGGWQWLYQGSLSAAAGALMTVCWGPDQTDTKRRARDGDISIAWTDGVPSAEIAISAARTWGGGVLRVPSGMGEPLESSAEGSAECIVYRVTVPAGDIRLARAAPRAAGTVSGSAPQWPVLRGAQSYAASATSGQRIGSSGWVISGAVSAACDTVAYSSATIWQIQSIASGGGSQSSTSVGNCDNYGTPVIYGASVDQGYFRAVRGYTHVAVSLTWVSRASETRTRTLYSGATVAYGAGISSSGAISIAQEQYAGGGWRDDVYSLTRDTATHATGDSTDADLCQYNSTGGAVQFYRCPAGGGSDVTVSSTYWDGSAALTVQTSGAAYLLRQAWMAGTDGSLREIEEAEWSGMLASTGEAAVPGDITSYRGSAIWTATPGADGRETNSGVSADAVYGALSWAGG